MMKLLYHDSGEHVSRPLIGPFCQMATILTNQRPTFLTRHRPRSEAAMTCSTRDSLTSRLSASASCSCLRFSSSSTISASMTALASATRRSTSVSISSRLLSSSSSPLLATSSSILAAALSSTLLSSVCFNRLFCLSTSASLSTSAFFDFLCKFLGDWSESEPLLDVEECLRLLCLCLSRDLCLLRLLLFSSRLLLLLLLSRF